jgi:hypothetical protein
MAYESGQYINEFLNNMPTLLLTMRKMDVDQMLETRKLDQVDIDQNLNQQKFDFESLIRDRQMSVMEAESGVSLEERAEAKRGRKAWRDIKGPVTKNMLQRLQLDEEHEEQMKNMGWWEQVFRPEEESFYMPFTDRSEEHFLRKSESQVAKEAAEKKYGKPRKPSEVFGDVQSMSADLTPQQFMQMYTDPYFQPQMLGNTGLMGLTTAGLVGGQYP